MTEDVKGKTLSIFYADGGSDTIPETHVSFDAIFNKLVSGSATDDKIRELTNVLETVARKMSALSERVSVDGTNVYFDGDPLAGELTEVIKSLFAEGSANLKPLVNFLEKAKQNPSQKSVDDLYRWIKKGDLVIDPDGDIIAYKGVGKDKNGNSQSIHTGTAFVDGVEFTGHIPNRPGTVVSMPRSEVDPNEMVGCSTGLHAGTHDYALKYLGWQRESRMILVKINPRDVVSVPTDEQDKKMRVSRYTVLSAIDLPDRLTSAVYQHDLQEEDLDDDYEEEYDEENWYDEDEEWDEEAEAEEAEAMERAYNTPDTDPYWTAVFNPVTEEEPEEEEEEEGDIYDALTDAEKSLAFPNRFEQELAARKAQEEAEEVVLSDVIREALQRFTKTDVVAKRDSSGRFVL
jgi:hypothetical protein